MKTNMAKAKKDQAWMLVKAENGIITGGVYGVCASSARDAWAQVKDVEIDEQAIFALGYRAKLCTIKFT